jgi:pimeloyl-ACP methyl ester carboxylesterase
MSSLGHERATIIGQSLGGGIAMQFAYQHPEQCERLILVSSGGLGEEVALVLRLFALPGSELIAPLLFLPFVRDGLATASRALAKIGLRPSPEVIEMWRSYGSLVQPDCREAFIHTLRSVIDVRGQRINAQDRLYLAASMPTLIVWGDADHIIPVSHGLAAHDAIPGSQLEVFEGVGHFPHCDEPDRFVEVVDEFIATNPAVRLSAEEWRQRLAVVSA